ncbi:MAG: TraR/DksA C4-type zinc finger protein [Patescibacteria group bacterium]
MDTRISTEKLLAEKDELEKELATVGRRNPANPADWEPVPADTDTAPSDRDEVAEKLETFEENIAIVRQLEARLEEVKTALGRIEHGTYGHCVACRGEIEPERLLANPAAATCKEHMK